LVIGYTGSLGYEGVATSPNKCQLKKSCSPEKLENIDVENVNNQLSSDDLIGETRNELRQLKSDVQRKVILVMRAFFITATGSQHVC